MFFRTRPVLIIVTTIAIGVAIAIRCSSTKRRPAAAPEPPKTAPVDVGTLLEPMTIDGSPLTLKPAKPRIVRTNSSEYAFADGWYIRSDAFRQQRLRKLSDALFKAG